MRAQHRYPTASERRAPGSTAFGGRAFEEIPRPSTTPLLGNLPDWRRPEQMLQILARYEAECGPLARFSLGPMRLLLVTDPVLARTVLRHEGFNTKGRLYVPAKMVLGNILVVNGDAWHRLRSRYARALHGVDVVGPVARMLDGALDGLESSVGDEPIDLEPVVWRLVADACMTWLCGRAIPDDNVADMRHIQDRLGTQLLDMLFRPWRPMWPEYWLSLRRAKARAREVFARIVERRLAAGEPGRDVLGRIIEAGPGPARTGTTEDDRQDTIDAVMSFFFTADDVLACALRWCLYSLAQHPSAQERLRAELAARELESAVLEPDSQPWLDCVLRECSRLYPGYSVFGRRNDEPMELGGHNVPAGTEVLISPFVMHRSARLWSQPERFRPERWLDGRTSRVVSSCDPYMPFGHGLRACIAGSVSWPLLRLMVGRIVRRFELRPVAGHRPRFRFVGTVHSEDGLPVRLRSARSRPVTMARTG